MTSKETEQNLEKLVQNIDPENFIFDFLLAFGFPKASVSRLRKGDFNRSTIPGEILYKGKIFFKESNTDKMLFEIEEISKDARILKQNPRIIFLTDWKTVVAKDLKTKVNKEFPLAELANHKDFFIPLTGAEIYKSTNDNKADREASYALANFYDIIIQDNPDLYKDDSHSLNLLLSRLLFCFFAEDTGIFEKESMFTDAIANNTAENGSDLAVFFKDLFAKLNTRSNKTLTKFGTLAKLETGTFPSYIESFPYVNGGLFKDEIKIPKFSRKSRDILLDCGNLNWGEINPDIFGSMIQAVADPSERSGLGMHYTSVPNILKLIKPLFLDELYDAFENNRENAKNLEKLLNRLSTIKFFDPACGSGNFLIITYKELRLLEIKIIQQLIDLDNEIAEKTNKSVGKQAKIYFPQIVLSQFYGIEIKDFAHEMAILSLWLAEHQMNKVFVEQLEGFGQTDPILPLKESGRISLGNAATMSWELACPKNVVDEIYIIGNPPYLGSRNQDAEQKNDMELVFRKDYKSLDYVTIWFYKGAKYIEGIDAQLAFVSTNSICQGLLVALNWPRILNENIEISFAHQSFKWINNAKGNAGVTVIIVGLRNTSDNFAIVPNYGKVGNRPKYLFNNTIRKEVKNINAYLLDSANIYIIPRTNSISKFPPMNFGNMPADGGHLLFTEEEKIEFFLKEPEAENWIKELISAHEFLNGKKRYCLWLEDISDEELENLPLVKERVQLVYNERIKSSRPQLANVPHLFAQITQPADSDFILIPCHSSEAREYIPIGFFSKEEKANNSNLIVATSEPYLFAILHSKMHMIWIDAVGGKLKTDYRYSAKLCYNTFPFPEISIKQKELLNQYVYDILDERAKFPQKTMAWLYNPDTMPKDLLKAHQALDLAIERIYRLAPFQSDAERLEFLFKLYDEMTKKDTLWAKEKKGRKKKDEA